MSLGAADRIEILTTLARLDRRIAQREAHLDVALDLKLVAFRMSCSIIVVFLSPPTPELESVALSPTSVEQPPPPPPQPVPLPTVLTALHLSLSSPAVDMQPPSSIIHDTPPSSAERGSLSVQILGDSGKEESVAEHPSTKKDLSPSTLTQNKAETGAPNRYDVLETFASFMPTGVTRFRRSK
ncbi:hypothetical protein KSP40_PGU018566 [Platanthera guangdongensis]|uniref:Uncharacterized protein n=1 Tax=Platanthera guangdongensis TaxID=2320717 RepID=A0ABR2MZH3_9ASPA